MNILLRFEMMMMMNIRFSEGKAMMRMRMRLMMRMKMRLMITERMSSWAVKDGWTLKQLVEMKKKCRLF